MTERTSWETRKADLELEGKIRARNQKRPPSHEEIMHRRQKKARKELAERKTRQAWELQEKSGSQKTMDKWQDPREKK